MTTNVSLPKSYMQVLDRITDAVYALDRDENAGGLGLGLAITRGIVELAGGTVRAGSAGLGTGSTFVLSFPLAGGEIPPSLPGDDQQRSQQKGAPS